MEEARRVLERLGRIDGLRASGAPPRSLLAELRALVREGEAWLAAEGTEAAGARRALTSLDETLRDAAVEPARHVGEPLRRAAGDPSERRGREPSPGHEAEPSGRREVVPEAGPP